MRGDRGDLLPSLGIACGAALWGLFWIPIRGIEAVGVPAYWTSTVIFAAGAVILLPFALPRLLRSAAHARQVLLPAVLAGLAFALWTVSLNLTEVVRAMLLFYISPVWSTLLGIFVLRERITLNRIVGLLLAFSGLYVVLVVDSGWPLPRNTGDWFALLSGVCWSIASVKLFQDGARLIVDKIALFLICSLLASLLLTLWQQGDLGGLPDLAELRAAWYWILLVAVLILPVTFLTIWPATVLSPARVGMLLMMELIVGVSSAAWLIDEPFGVRELAGTLLILSAGIVEVAREQRFGAAGEGNPARRFD